MSTASALIMRALHRCPAIFSAKELDRYMRRASALRGVTSRVEVAELFIEAGILDLVASTESGSQPHAARRRSISVSSSAARAAVRCGFLARDSSDVLQPALDQSGSVTRRASKRSRGARRGCLAFPGTKGAVLQGFPCCAVLQDGAARATHRRATGAGSHLREPPRFACSLLREPVRTR